MGFLAKTLHNQKRGRNLALPQSSQRPLQSKNPEGTEFGRKAGLRMVFKTPRIPEWHEAVALGTIAA